MSASDWHGGVRRGEGTLGCAFTDLADVPFGSGFPSESAAAAGVSGWSVSVCRGNEIGVLDFCHERDGAMGPLKDVGHHMRTCRQYDETEDRRKQWM